MSLRISVTRALPDAESTAARLRERGAEPIIAPLLKIIPRAFEASLQGVQALAFTSANGVRAFPLSGGAAETLVFAVGDATAKAAREAGFHRVRSADGDVEALAALMRAALNARAGTILHISGADVSGDLVGRLQAAGFIAERSIVYTAVAATALPEALRGSLDVVLFHSVRAAEIFAALGAPGSPHLVAACLSEQVAQAARATAWKRIVVAPAPREEALLDVALKG